MNEKLSALMDNELDEIEARRLLASLATDAPRRAVWERYHLIGSVLRREPLTVMDVTGRVSEQLTSSTAKRPGARIVGQLALAASVAAIAVVGAQWWLAGRSQPEVTVAQRDATPVEYLRADRTRWDTNQREAEGTLNAFLVEHNEFAPTSGVGGILPYVRVVGYDNER